MHVSVIYIVYMMLVGSMGAPDFRKGVLRGRANDYLDITEDIIDNIEAGVINRAQSIRRKARDVVSRTDLAPETDGGFFSNLLARILQPYFNIKDAAITNIKLFIQSVLSGCMKDVLNDFIPENLVLYLGLGLGIIAVSLACCVGWCCVGYFTLLKELKKISGIMTDLGGSLPRDRAGIMDKDTMYVNCLDIRR